MGGSFLCRELQERGRNAKGRYGPVSRRFKFGGPR